jgi:hypothetical protein
MKEKMLYKTLVVGVIVLFVGMGVQPAVAVTPDTNESEDDCNLCAKKVSKSQLTLLENSLNRLEKYENQLSILSKQYPQFEEKYKEISKGMMSLREVNKELKSDNFDINKFCYIAYYLIFILIAPAVFYSTWDVNLFTNLLLPFVIIISIPGLILLITWMALCYSGPT